MDPRERTTTTTRARALLATFGAVGLLAACAGGSVGARSSPTVSTGAISTARTSAPATTTAPPAHASWTTYLHDPARSGFSSDGPTAPKTIRRQWRSPILDGEVYAEPLLVGNRIIVATENDSVYALDATNGAVAWRTHVGQPVAASSLPCGNVDPVGITSTPVVNAGAGRVYVVGLIGPVHHELFALNLTTGLIVASVSVDAPGADPKVHNQRSALTLSGGRVVIPFGGRFGDCGDYHGRVVSVKVTASGLGAMASYLLPTQGEGGFWSPPGATTAADGSMYFTSGNSSSSTTYDYGNSVVRIGAGLTLLDSFAPTNWKTLNAVDGDLGSSGPVLLPGGRIFQVGKSAVGYLLDAAHLGGIGGELHSARVCVGAGVWGAIAHDGDTMYVPCSGSVVQVTVASDSFTVGWKTAVSTPGPTVVTPAAVWTVETATGKLIALDPATGATLASIAIGTVPSRFTVAAVGGGRVVVAANRRVSTFGV